MNWMLVKKKKYLNYKYLNISLKYFENKINIFLNFNLTFKPCNE